MAEKLLWSEHNFAKCVWCGTSGYTIVPATLSDERDHIVHLDGFKARTDPGMVNSSYYWACSEECADAFEVRQVLKRMNREDEQSFRLTAIQRASWRARAK